MALVDLGTSVVLDAHSMYEGMYVVIDKQVFVVSKMVDSTKIILRPLTTKEWIMYQLNKYKVLITFSLVFLGIIVVLLLKG
jgi:hypothetical protein